jgi:hypothetical protein
MTIFDPERAEELQQLLTEYLSASVMVAGTLRIEPAAQQLEDAAMARFMGVDAKIAAIVRKVEESLGAAGRA